MDEAIWQEFRRTCIRVSLPDGTFDVEPAEEAASGPYLPGAKGPIHVLTAWNPQGLKADEADNRAANARFAAELANRPRLRVWPVTGYGGGALDDDGTWREEGFGIEGLSRNDALALGVAYDQAAIFEWRNEPGGFRLVACDASADEPRGWRALFLSGA